MTNPLSTINAPVTYENISFRQKRVEKNIEKVDLINSRDHCIELEKDLSEFVTSKEKIWALNCAKDSKVKACLSGFFSVLGGSLGFLALGILTAPFSILLQGQVFLPGFSTLGKIVRCGYYCLTEISKKNEQIASEIDENQKKFANLKAKFEKEITPQNNKIIELFKEISEDITYIKNNEDKLKLKMSSDKHSFLLIGITSRTINWDQLYTATLGICAENARYVQLTQEFNEAVNAGR